MALKLPRLTTTVDCEPLGYPGLCVVFWLNVTNPEREWEPPDDPQRWDTPWYAALAEMIERIVIPADMTDDGEELVIELPDGEAVWNLERMPGFDQAILPWSLGVLKTERDERLAVERKN